MTRPTAGGGGSVHVGKAAALILVALLVGIIVLRDDSGGTSLSAAQRAAIDNLTSQTTVDSSSDDSSDSGDEETTETTLALREPSQVKVVAINATQQAGVAGRATSKLQTEGYNALAPGNATTAFRGTNPAAAVYVVTAGYEREAAAVAALFGLPASAVRTMPTPSPSPDIKEGVNVALIIGTGITI